MSENDFDPEDVLASTGVTVLVRVSTFFAAWVLGQGIGLLSAQFAKFGDLMKIVTTAPDPDLLLAAISTIVPVMFVGAVSLWFTPWILVFFYFASQFLLVEGGWERWFPWLAVGQAVFCYLVMDNYGIGVVFLILGCAAVIAGWNLLETKLNERTMRRFDAIEAENRRKRSEKAKT